VEKPYVLSSSVNFPKNCVRILLTQELEFISSQKTEPVLESTHSTSKVM
jgi:hypothetical protein